MAGHALELLTLLLRWGYVGEGDCCHVCRAALHRPQSFLPHDSYRQRALELFHLVFVDGLISKCVDAEVDPGSERGLSHGTQALELLLQTTAGIKAAGVGGRGSSNVEQSQASTAHESGVAARELCTRRVITLRALLTLLRELMGDGAHASTSGGQGQTATSSSAAAAAQGGGEASFCEIVEAMMLQNDETGLVLRDWPFALACLVNKQAVSEVQDGVLVAYKKLAAAPGHASSQTPKAPSAPARRGARRSTPANPTASSTQASSVGSVAGGGVGGAERDGAWVDSVCKGVLLSLLLCCKEATDTHGVAGWAACAVGGEKRGAHQEDTQHCKRLRAAALQLLAFISDSAESETSSSSSLYKLPEVALLLSRLIPHLPLKACDSKTSSKKVLKDSDILESVCMDLKTHFHKPCSKSTQLRVAAFFLSTVNT